MSDLRIALTILGLTLVSVVNRSFFFLSRREIPLPPGVVRGLRYAPLGALVAVVAPDIVRVESLRTSGPCDARIWAAALAVLYTRRRPRDMFGTIALGMAVYLGLHLGLGW